jgi:hypothetical protein
MNGRNGGTQGEFHNTEESEICVLQLINTLYFLLSQCSPVIKPNIYQSINHVEETSRSGRRVTVNRDVSWII